MMGMSGRMVEPTVVLKRMKVIDCKPVVREQRSVDCMLVVERHYTIAVLEVHHMLAAGHRLDSVQGQDAAVVDCRSPPEVVVGVSWAVAGHMGFPGVVVGVRHRIVVDTYAVAVERQVLLWQLEPALFAALVHMELAVVAMERILQVQPVLSG